MGNGTFYLTESKKTIKIPSQRKFSLQQVNKKNASEMKKKGKTEAFHSVYLKTICIVNI